MTLQDTPVCYCVCGHACMCMRIWSLHVGYAVNANAQLAKRQTAAHAHMQMHMAPQPSAHSALPHSISASVVTVGVWEYELYGGAQLAPHRLYVFVFARFLTPPKGVWEGPTAMVHLPRNTRCRFVPFPAPLCAFLASSPDAPARTNPSCSLDLDTKLLTIFFIRATKILASIL
eukprot:scaffold5010_cov110-Isochrysis_galbana.AAC.5